ncbi:MAG TPA: hypothetical protein VK749_20085 [Xanthobacteraceae bacterium]|nr:hypothetical protein [Xanthobacteraceae bacterium]
MTARTTIRGTAGGEPAQDLSFSADAKFFSTASDGAVNDTTFLDRTS